jgi:hypothetical protein
MHPAQPAVIALVLAINLLVVFSLCERKNDQQKEEKYRCEHDMSSTA